MKLKPFVLTRDMAPIHYISFENDQKRVAFICPLPMDYKKVIENEALRKRLWKGVTDIIKNVNAKALKLESPFENMLVEYSDRSEKDQAELLKNFQIKEYNLDDRGLYCVANWGAEGDIYLDGNTMHSCDFLVDGFREFFEPRIAFQCHNVDYYWQALLTREVVVEYFNLLRTLLQEL